ncbi:MAG: polysaccharide deacetylase family protein [Bacteroidia bacterium]|nr:MAG: polysaccharide deacetylase family protein [Bacteroidia bacterium]PIE86531.1 MAG: polysaccharide deacetylase family protein [Bacteroidia bacterium]
MLNVKSPIFIRKLFNQFVWDIKTKEKNIYLSFDDGPIPRVTEKVLDILQEYDAKATFFCVGENVYKYPQIYKKVVNAKHAVGNHTYNHLKGWQTNTQDYINNVERANALINTKLFRPPYGKITSRQANILKKTYKIVMWSVVSRDFDPHISQEQCYKNVIENTSSGSIVVFHDSLKTEKKVLHVLPRVLKYFSEKGYQLMPILNEASDR